MAELVIRTDGTAEGTLVTLNGLPLDDVAHVKVVVRRRDETGLRTAHEVEIAGGELERVRRDRKLKAEGACLTCAGSRKVEAGLLPDFKLTREVDCHNCGGTGKAKPTP